MADELQFSWANPMLFEKSVVFRSFLVLKHSHLSVTVKNIKIKWMTCRKYNLLAANEIDHNFSTKYYVKTSIFHIEYRLYTEDFQSCSFIKVTLCI